MSYDGCGLCHRNHRRAVHVVHDAAEGEKDMVVVGEASNGREAIEVFRSKRPDVTVMDLQMPSLNGIELAWCLENVDKAPHVGWLREVYYHLGKLALADGDQAKAQDYLRRSGYKDFDRPITLTTSFSEAASTVPEPSL